ncbi:MAG: nitroreductase [Methylovirgula sp.]|uniref:nitroreductase family protein n=1 Tax=Methylovirgula sp. TaxID=1978224 RepID=UPI003075F9E5
MSNLSHAPEQGLSMDVTEAIYGRRATRNFTTAPVAADILTKLVDAAIQAPSAFNAQPWHFTIIRNLALLDRISAAAKPYMLSMLNPKSTPNGIREHLSNPDFHVFYHAPAMILISGKESEWAVEDVGLAAENLMLAAHSAGLGTCWIGFAQPWLKTPEGKRAVELDSIYIPIAPIIVGYARETPPPVPRNPPLLQWID